MREVPAFTYEGSLPAQIETELLCYGSVTSGLKYPKTLKPNIWLIYAVPCPRFVGLPFVKV